MEISMDRFEELKQKYASVLAAVQQQGVRLAHLHVQDNKLFMEGAAPSAAIKNALWNQIKAINPAYDDITVNVTVDPSLPQPAPSGGPRQTYTVQAGDSLSRIAKQFYGNADEYMRIFDANKDKLNDPNRIQIGQELVIPAGR
jgi:nucleoid-associated protein YgaU